MKATINLSVPFVIQNQKKNKFNLIPLFTSPLIYLTQTSPTKTKLKVYQYEGKYYNQTTASKTI